MFNWLRKRKTERVCVVTLNGVMWGVFSSQEKAQTAYLDWYVKLPINEEPSPEFETYVVDWRLQQRTVRYLSDEKGNPPTSVVSDNLHGGMDTTSK